MKIAIPYHRELYRLWFEYLRVARARGNRRTANALQISARFYAPWGDVTTIKFDTWWKTHGRLFEEKYTVRRLRRGEYSSDPDSLVIEVPLNKSSSELTKDIKTLLKAAFNDLGNDRPDKSKRRPSSIYRPTQGAEPKLLALREMLTVYRDVYLKNPNLRGERLLDAVHSFYKSRKNKRWAKIPTPLMKDSDMGIIRPLRNLRRYIQKAEKIVFNTARGEFPGQY